MSSDQKTAKTDKISFFREFRSIRSHVREYRWRYILGLLFLILTDAGQIVIPRFLGRAVDIIAGGEGGAALVGRLMLIVVGLAILVAVGRYGWRNYIIGSARRIENDLRHRLYDRLLTLSSSFFGRNKVGDLMARATNDLQAVRMATGMALIAFVDSVFMTLFILITLFAGYGTLGFIVIIPLPLVSLMALVLGQFVAPLFGRVQRNFSRISEHVQETLAGIRVVKSFATEEKALEDFRDINADYGEANMTLIRFWGMLFPAMGFVAGLSVLLLLYFGGIRVLDGSLSPGDFVAALSYIGMLVWPAMGAGWVVNMLQRGAASMQRINVVLDEQPDIVDKDDAIDRVPTGDLEFRQASYAYSPGENIINDVSFTVRRGESTGILGRTGSGKTTLIKLVPRILDPKDGTVFIGGEDIREFRRDSLRRALGVVPQDVFLFSQTIRENIIFARPEASTDDIEAAVQAAGLANDLPFFPQGLETIVGEKGVTLSGGQKQRIAIARALISDPEILILDDALSAVDAETEERILGNIFQLRGGKTTLMISHRVSALSRCDTTVVLEDGRITASGTHEQLLTGGGFYKDIADLQKLEAVEEASA